MDARARRTHTALITAAQELICELTPDELSVVAVTRRAKVHRKTFYRHFPTIDDLLTALLDDAASRYTTAALTLPKNANYISLNRLFINYLTSCDPWVERIYCEPSYSQLCNRLSAMNLRHNRERFNPFAHLPPAEQALVNNFMVSSSIGVFRHWVATGKRVPVERLIELSGQLLEHGASAVAQR